MSASPGGALRAAALPLCALAVALAVSLALPESAFAQTATLTRSERVLSSDPATAFQAIAVSPSGSVYVAAGNAGILAYPAAAAGPVTFADPAGSDMVAAAVDPATGNVYAADAATHQIDIITPAGTVSQLTIDGAVTAQVSQLAIANGKVYIAGQAGSHLSSPGVLSLPLGGGASTVISTTAYTALAADSAGNVFVASVSPATVAVFRGGTGSPVAITGGVTWIGPRQLAVDATGNLYVADEAGSSGQLVKVAAAAGATPAASQLITTDATFTQVTPAAVATDAQGNVYWSNPQGTAASNYLNVVGALDANFLAQAVGSPSATARLVFTVTGSGTFATPEVLTQGVAGADFALTADTCQGALTSGATCTVSVTWTPSSAGLKRGAVVLYNSATPAAPVATVYLRGVGVGGAVGFAPVRQVLASPTTNPPISNPFLDGIATDGHYVYAEENGTSVLRVNTAGGLDNSGGFPVLGISGAVGLALDGAGNLWATDTAGIEEAVRRADGSYASFVNKVSLTAAPADLLVDASANVFIVSGDSNSVLEYRASGGAAVTLAGATACSMACDGLGMDANGNLYYSINNVPQEVPAAALNGSTNPTATPLTGVQAMLDYVFDAAGDLFTVSQLMTSIDEYPLQNGVRSTTPIVLQGSATTSYISVAVDAAGNVYAADNTNGEVDKFTLGAAPTLAFGQQAQNVSSSPQSTTLTNIGNTTLTFATPALTLTTGTQFAVNVSSTCTAGATLAAGQSCTVAATFKPTTAGALSDSLNIHSNALTLSPVTLTGTGQASPLTLTLKPGTSLTYGGSGNAVTVTATGTLGTPTGTIAWTLDGTPEAAVALAAGSATLALPATLSAGSHTVVITYSGDSNYASLAGAPSETATLTLGPISITPALSGTVTKVYDSTATATLTAANIALPGMLSADAAHLTATATQATYAQTSAGSGITVTATGIALSGSAIGNYVLSSNLASAAIGTITAAPVTVAIVGAPAKAYDGTTTAALTAANLAVSGLFPVDLANLAVTFGPGAYNSANVADASSVSAALTGLTGSAAGNYALTQTVATGAGKITPAPLGVTAASLTVALGLPLPSISGTVTSGQLFAADTLSSIGVTCSTSATASSPIGLYTTSCAGTPANYTATFATGTLTLAPAPAAVPAAAVGQTSGTFPVVFLFSSSAVVQSVRAVSGGANDYAVAGASNCVGAFSAGQSCTVNVTFTPETPGARPGAVELLDSNGNVLQTAYFNGSSQGALLTSPSSPVITSVTTTPGPVAADAEGNIFDGAGTHQMPTKLLRSNRNGGFTDAVPFSGTVSALALGGDGRVYLAANGNAIVVCANSTTLACPGQTIAAPGVAAVAVDGWGDVLYSTSGAGGVIHKVTPAGTASTLGTGIAAASPLAVDGAGDVYAMASAGGVVSISPAGVQTTVTNTSGISSAQGLAVDAAGDVFIEAAGQITEYMAGGAHGQIGATGSTSANYLAYDHFGSLFGYANGSSIYDLTAGSGSALALASTPVGQKALAYRIFVNAGNTPLTFTTVAVTGAGFSLDPANTCAVGASVAPGKFCEVVLDFAPSAQGTLTGTLTLNSNSTANSALSIPLSGTGTPALQAITITSPTAVTYGVAPITLSATGGASGNPVTFSYISGPATLTNGTLTITGAGTVALDANQAGNANYAAAPQLAFSIVVAPAPQTIHFPNPLLQVAPLPAVTPGTVLTLVGTASSNLPVSFRVDAGPAAVSGTMLTVTGAGTVTVEADQAGNANYAAATPVTQSFIAGTPSADILPLSRSIRFGSTAVGRRSTYQLVVVRNGSTVPLLMGAAQLSGPNLAEFALHDECSGKVVTTTACAVLISFTPTAPGDASATLTLNDSASPSTQTVTLAGIGMGAGVRFSGTVNFGPQVLSTTGTPQGVTIYNTGNQDLHITGMQVVAADGVTPDTEFAVSPGCQTVAAATSCTLAVVFTPAAAGDRSAALRLTDDTPEGHDTVPLTGNGVDVGLTLSQSGTLQFSATLVGSQSDTEDITLNYNGTTPLTGVTAVATGDFVIQSAGTTCAGTLQESSPGVAGTCTIAVAAKPTLPGAETGSVVITDSRSTLPITVPLSVTGLAASANLSTDLVNFGGTPVYSTSDAQSVQLSNLGNTGLDNIKITASGSFAVAGTSCGATLAAGAHCGINVASQPTLAGAQTGTLSVSDSAGTQMVTLTGFGQVVGLEFQLPVLYLVRNELLYPQPDVIITNTGNVPISPTFTFSNLGLGVYLGSTSSCGRMVPGQSCVLQIGVDQSKPLPAGVNSETLTATAGSATAIEQIKIQVQSGSMYLYPSQLAFGATPVGQLYNKGYGDLFISGIDVNGATITGDFQITADECSGHPNPGGCLLQVAPKAVTTGHFTGDLILHTTRGPFSVPLSANGVAAGGLEVTPSTLRFGSVPVSQSGATTSLSRPGLLLLTNPNSTPLTVRFSYVPSGFSVTNTCGSSVPAHGSCWAIVQFTPTTTGQARVWPIIIHDNSIVGSSVVLVSGYGSPTGVTLSPPVLNFGGVQPGHSATQNETITNNTGGAIMHLGVTATGGYSTSGTCPTTLANGSSCTVLVTFTPPLSTTITGTIFITGSLPLSASSNAAVRRNLQANPEAGSGGSLLALTPVSGSGNPAAITTSASSLVFASQAAGTSSAAQTVTITNSGGSDLTGITLFSTPDFPETSTCGATLAAGATCTASVAFAPVTGADGSGTLTLSADGGLSAEVALSGTATGGLLRVAPSSLNFYNWPQGTRSQPQTLVISNSGTSALQLQSLALAGAGFAQSSSTCSPLPISLAPGADCTLALTYTPAQAAAGSGSVTIASSAGNATVSLAGSTSTASGGSFTLTADRTSTSVQAGQSAAFTLALTPGTFTGTVSLTCTGAPAASSCSVVPPQLSLAAGGAAASALVTVTTSAGNAGFMAPPLPLHGPSAWQWMLIAAAGLLLFLMMRLRAPRRRRWLLGAIAAMALAAAACGGHATPRLLGGTPPGTYPLTVTATSGTVTHTVQISLTVE